MKILFLARRFYPDTGGVEKHVREISKVLIKKGHQVAVITQSQGEENEIDKIKIVRIPQASKSSSEKLHIWKWLIRNWRLIRAADVVHVHDVYFWYLPARLLFLGKKSFITFHGYESYPIKRKAVIIRKISELLSDGNIIVGDFIKKWYHAKPDYVIYGGSTPYKSSDGKVTGESALFFGRLDEHTGILEYAKAVDIVRKAYPKFQFKILGEGKYENKLKRFKPSGYKDNINEHLTQYKFAFVSRYLSILEALMAKRLVFAVYDNPIKEDYLKMSPFAKHIVIADNPQNLARKVKYFLGNEEELKKFTKSGYEWAKNQTWENIVNIYLDLWKK
jgi:glycosyltransferase involved in cell wall biosynthesis